MVPVFFWRLKRLLEKIAGNKFATTKIKMITVLWVSHTEPINNSYLIDFLLMIRSFNRVYFLAYVTRLLLFFCWPTEINNRKNIPRCKSKSQNVLSFQKPYLVYFPKITCNEIWKHESWLRETVLPLFALPSKAS